MRWRSLLTGRGAQHRRKLSVVIPVYNLEELLPRCLDSVLVQPVPDLEVVIVDDGSVDGSAQVAATYAARDARVRLVRQENGGVSRARNAGVDRCSGGLLTFVDPDDVLPADAWGGMMRTLERTGSEIAVGNMERVGADGRRWELPLLKRNHVLERLAVTIDDVPLMTADVFPCNKIFRMDFWRRHQLSFPVDVRYEDQVLCTQALLLARTFDVLTDVVYEWHMREDLSSATQARATSQNLRDRFVTKQMTLDLVLHHGNSGVIDTLYREVLPIDMWEYFRAAVAPSTPNAEEYWSGLRKGLLAIWNEGTVPFEQTGLPLGQRLMGWLVAQDRRADLARLVAEIDGPGVRVAGGRYLHPWVDKPGVPPELTYVRSASE